MRRDDLFEILRRRKESLQAEKLSLEHQDLLKFAIGKEWYGLNISVVVEVIAIASRIFRVPHTPDYIIGVINLRGEILPVVDIRKLLGEAIAITSSDEKLSLESSKHIVVVGQDSVKIGIIVDRASDVISVPVSDIKPPLSNVERAKNFIAGEVQLRGDVLSILNLDALMEGA